MKRVVKFNIWVHVEVPNDAPDSDAIGSAERRLKEVIRPEAYHKLRVGKDGCYIDLDDVEDEE
jgi:hypothetical protein